MPVIQPTIKEEVENGIQGYMSAGTTLSDSYTISSTCQRLTSGVGSAVSYSRYGYGSSSNSVVIPYTRTVDGVVKNFGFSPCLTYFNANSTSQMYRRSYTIPDKLTATALGRFNLDTGLRYKGVVAISGSPLAMTTNYSTTGVGAGLAYISATLEYDTDNSAWYYVFDSPGETVYYAVDGTSGYSYIYPIFMALVE